MNKKLLPIIIISFLIILPLVQAGPLFDWLSNNLRGTSISDIYRDYQGLVEFFIYSVVFISLIIGVFEDRFGNRQTKIIAIALGIALAIGLVNFMPGLIGRLGALAFLIFVALYWYIIFASLKKGFENKVFAMSLAYILAFLTFLILDQENKFRELFGSVAILAWLKDALLFLFLIASIIVLGTILWFVVNWADRRRRGEPSYRPIKIETPERLRGEGFTKRLWDKVQRGILGAEEETKTELAGLKDVENRLEDIPNLLERLKGKPGSRTINETARQIMKIVNSADIHERKFIAEFLETIGPVLENSKHFIGYSAQNLPQLQHISSTSEFQNYPPEFKQKILGLLREMPEMIQQLGGINSYFMERFGKSKGLFNRLVMEFNDRKGEVEDALRHVDYNHVAAIVHRMIEIERTIGALLQEAIGKERELGKLVIKGKSIDATLKEVNEGIASVVSGRTQGQRSAVLLQIAEECIKVAERKIQQGVDSNQALMESYQGYVSEIQQSVSKASKEEYNHAWLETMKKHNLKYRAK